MYKSETVFFLANKLANGMCDVSVVTPERYIDVTLIHQSWELRGKPSEKRVYIASNSPLETVTYADPQIPVRSSPEELIVISGQNSTEMLIDIEESEYPCLLSTGAGIETHDTKLEGMLAIHNWSETADFRADQSYWITRYKRQIEKGDKFLQSHLDDYERERKLAASLALRSGARLPISFMHEARLCIGCLILESVEGNRFTGRLYANLKLDIAPTKLERFVKSDNGQVIRQLVAANIKCLKGGPQLPLL